MKLLKITCLAAAAFGLAACEGGEGIARIGPDKSVDRGINSHDLSTMVAGIWVDPNGCDHWIIDDGLEGYLSQRLDRSGKPVCSGAAPSGVATGPFKEGSSVPDLM